MNARDYFRKYGRQQCESIAIEAGTKPGYFMQMVYGHRRPSPELAQKLVAASKQKLDFAALLAPRAQ